MQNRVPQRGSAPKMAVQSTLPKKGSSPNGQCRAQYTSGQCTVPKKGSAEYSHGGAVRTQPQGQCREKTERRAVASSSA